MTEPASEPATPSALDTPYAQPFGDILIAVPNPAAGAGFAYTVPLDGWDLVKCVRLTLVTSAVVANRYVNLGYAGPSGTVFYSAVVNQSQPASKTTIWTYSIAPLVANKTLANGTILYQLALPEVWLRAGSQVTVTVDAVDTADQISGIALLVARHYRDDHSPDAPPHK